MKYKFSDLKVSNFQQKLILSNDGTIVKVYFCRSRSTHVMILSKDGGGLVSLKEAIFGKPLADTRGHTYSYLVADKLTTTTPTSEACKQCGGSYTFGSTGAEYRGALFHRLTCPDMQEVYALIAGLQGGPIEFTSRPLHTMAGVLGNTCRSKPQSSDDLIEERPSANKCRALKRGRGNTSCDSVPIEKRARLNQGNRTVMHRSQRSNSRVLRSATPRSIETENSSRDDSAGAEHRSAFVRRFDDKIVEVKWTMWKERIKVLTGNNNDEEISPQHMILGPCRYEWDAKEYLQKDPLTTVSENGETCNLCGKYSSFGIRKNDWRSPLNHRFKCDLMHHALRLELDGRSGKTPSSKADGQATRTSASDSGERQGTPRRSSRFVSASAKPSTAVGTATHNEHTTTIQVPTSSLQQSICSDQPNRDGRKTFNLRFELVGLEHLPQGVMHVSFS